MSTIKIYCILQIDRSNSDFADIIVAKSQAELLSKVLALHQEVLERYGYLDSLETDAEYIREKITDGIYDIKGEYIYTCYKEVEL
jgi:hypothetical protein